MVLKTEKGNEYKIGNILGKGGLATVFKATELLSGQLRAIKVYPAVHQDSFNKERQMMRMIQDCPQCCPLYETYTMGRDEGKKVFGSEGERHILILGYYAHGDLRERWKRDGKRVKYALIRKWIKQMVQVVLLLAQQKITHGDIHIRNFLLDDQDNIILCDFGHAHRIVLRHQVELSTEIRAIGKILYRMLIDYGRVLNSGENLDENRNLPIRKDAPKAAFDLMKKMVLPPDRQILLGDIMEHEYMKL